MKAELCFYCREPAAGMDHTHPVSAIMGKRRGKHRLLFKDLQVPACIECNSLLGNRLFPTMEDRLRYLLERLVKRKVDASRIRYLARVLELSEKLPTVTG